MSLPDPSAPRKLNRWGLYGPFLAVAIAAVAWSGVWVWTRNEAALRLDAAAQAWGKAGYELTWRRRELGGYPFRLDVTLIDVALREPGGWALISPRIEAEAYAYAPTQWLIAAPRGLTFVRPEGGPVTVTGGLIRASLGHPRAHPPSLSFEGVGLAFQPGPGAEPFALTRADRVEFHLRAGPDDEGGVFAAVTNGRARLSGLFARIAGDKPLSFEWNSTVSKMSAFTGVDWPDAVRHWTDAGGKMTVRKAAIVAGDAVIAVDSGTLSAADDGRLSGQLKASLRQAPHALNAMGETGVLAPGTVQSAQAVVQAGVQTGQGDGEIARATIDFQAGRTTLGPVALGPAPRVYTSR